jgi:glutaredoxin 2
MNLVFMILGMIGLNNYSVKDDLSREDKKFVKTVIRMHGDKPLAITRKNESKIMIEYPETVYILDNKGFISSVWILEDNAWLNLGPDIN